MAPPIAPTHTTSRVTHLVAAVDVCQRAQHRLCIGLCAHLCECHTPAVAAAVIGAHRCATDTHQKTNPQRRQTWRQRLACGRTSLARVACESLVAIADPQCSFAHALARALLRLSSGRWRHGDVDPSGTCHTHAVNAPTRWLTTRLPSRHSTMPRRVFGRRHARRLRPGVIATARRPGAFGGLRPPCGDVVPGGHTPAAAAAAARAHTRVTAQRQHSYSP